MFYVKSTYQYDGIRSGQICPFARHEGIWGTRGVAPLVFKICTGWGMDSSRRKRRINRYIIIGWGELPISRPGRFTWDKIFPASTKYESGWVPAPVWLWRKPLPLPGIETRIHRRLARRSIQLNTQ